MIKILVLSPTRYDSLEFDDIVLLSGSFTGMLFKGDPRSGENMRRCSSMV